VSPSLTCPARWNSRASLSSSLASGSRRSPTSRRSQPVRRAVRASLDQLVCGTEAPTAGPASRAASRQNVSGWVRSARTWVAA
jgi:hypothetical protein